LANSTFELPLQTLMSID